MAAGSGTGLPIASEGIATEAGADTYFSTRLGASDYWTSETEKTVALTTAENQLTRVYGNLEETTEVEQAIYEQALFLLMDSGVDRRRSLQAQGVREAGFVQEKYDRGMGGIAICPFAAEVLGDSKSALFAAEVEMDTEDD